MRVTRNQLRQMILKEISTNERQSLKENEEFQMREIAKKALIDKIKSFESYKRLIAAEAKISSLKQRYIGLQYNSYSDLIIRAVEEENLSALQSRSRPYTYDIPNTPPSRISSTTFQVQKGLRAIYNVKGDELFQIRDGMERDFENANFLIHFTNFQNQAGKALSKFLRENPYVEPPQPGFFQRARNFLGFNE